MSRKCYLRSKLLLRIIEHKGYTIDIQPRVKGQKGGTMRLVFRDVAKQVTNCTTSKFGSIKVNVSKVIVCLTLSVPVGCSRLLK